MYVKPDNPIVYGIRKPFAGFGRDLGEMLNPALPYQRHKEDRYYFYDHDDVFSDNTMGSKADDTKSATAALVKDFMRFPAGLYMILRGALSIPKLIAKHSLRGQFIKALTRIPFALGLTIGEVLSGAIQTLLSPLTLAIALTTRLVATGI